MIIEYQRPKTIEEAVQLLSRDRPRSKPLGGGAFLSQNNGEEIAVVDIQSLELNQIAQKGESRIIGAATTLEDLLNCDSICDDLKTAIGLEAPINTRNIATVAGAVVASTGNSPFATCLLAMDTETIWLPGEKRVTLGNWLPLRKFAPGVLLKSFNWSETISLRYFGVGRSPFDRPFLCIALAIWPSGRVRIILGAKELTTPALVLDGRGHESFEAALINACSHFTNNQYIINISINITKRLLHTGAAL
jgi:hypothetical protein